MDNFETPIDTPTQAQPVSIDTGEVTSPVLSPKPAQQRSAKASFALAPLTGQSCDEIHRGLSDGKDRGVRKRVDAQTDYKKIVIERLIRLREEAPTPKPVF